MKILYVGTLHPSGTCFSRFESLRALEPDVHGFDTDPVLRFQEMNIFARSIERHLAEGPRHAQANAALLARCRELQPDLVWVDKGDWIRSATLRALREQGVFLVHHITDSLFTSHVRSWLRRRLLRSTRSDYDVFFTTNIDDPERLVADEPPRSFLTDLGYAHRRFEPSPLPPELAERWASDIRFIGHYEPETGQAIRAVLDADLPVQVNGPPPWSRMPEA